MTLNKDLTAVLRFKNVACQSVSVPTRPLHSSRGCHGCHMFVTWLVPVSGWIIRYRGTVSYYIHTEPYIFRHVW